MHIVLRKAALGRMDTLEMRPGMERFLQSVKSNARIPGGNPETSGAHQEVAANKRTVSAEVHNVHRSETETPELQREGDTVQQSPATYATAAVDSEGGSETSMPEPQNEGNYGKSLVGPTLYDGAERSSIGVHRYDDEGKDILLNTTIITGRRSRRSVGAEWNSRMKKVLVSITGAVPPFGGIPVGKLISSILNLFWPDSQPDVWSLIKDQVEGLIDEKIFAKELQERNNEIRAIKRTMQMYVDARIREKGSLMSTLIHACNELFVKLTQSSDSVQLIPLVVTHSAQHLLILKERLLHGKEMYDEDNTDVWRKELEEQISSYKDCIKDIYSKWVEWRNSKIIVDAGTTLAVVGGYMGGFAFGREPYGEVYDQIGKDKVSYRESSHYYGKSDFRSLCEAVKKKWFSLRNGEMLQVLVPTFYLDNFIPGNEDNPSVTPSAMSIASFGPISPHLDGKIRNTLFYTGDNSVLYTPDNDNTGGGNVTRICVREDNIIEGFQVFYSSGAGLIYGSSSGAKVHEIYLQNRRVKSINFCYTKCSQASLTIGFSNGDSTGPLGNRNGSPVTCVETGGIDTYGLYNIRAHDNVDVRRGDCVQGLFQIELDYKAYPVRPSEIHI